MNEQKLQVGGPTSPLSITAITRYVTPDGKEWETEVEATRHQARCDLAALIDRGAPYGELSVEDAIGALLSDVDAAIRLLQAVKAAGQDAASSNRESEEPGMNLWLITQETNTRFEAHYAAVIAARTERDARLTYPGRPDGSAEDRVRYWAPPAAVAVKRLGTACAGTAAGVIMTERYPD